MGCPSDQSRTGCEAHPPCRMHWKLVLYTGCRSRVALVVHCAGWRLPQRVLPPAVQPWGVVDGRLAPLSRFPPIAFPTAGGRPRTSDGADSLTADRRGRRMERIKGPHRHPAAREKIVTETRQLPARRIHQRPLFGSSMTWNSWWKREAGKIPLSPRPPAPAAAIWG